MSQKIQSLRARIDDLNLSIMELLSQRATIAAEIGAEQTARGMSQYDPVREQQMLDALVRANTGPFDDATLKALFKQIFQASMQLSQTQEQRSYLTSRSAKPGDGDVSLVGDEAGGCRAPDPTSRTVCG